MKRFSLIVEIFKINCLDFFFSFFLVESVAATCLGQTVFSPAPTTTIQHNTQNRSGSDICQQVGVWCRWGAGRGGWGGKAVPHWIGQNRFGQTRFGQSRFWPNSVLAKLGQTLKTLTLAEVGLAKVGHDRIPNVVIPGKTFHSKSIGSPSIRSKSLR